MACRGPRNAFAPLLVAALAVASPVTAQPLFVPAAELSAAVSIDEVETAARKQLETAAALVADEQWDEAVETLRQVQEKYARKLVQHEPGRYVTVAELCQRRIAALPPEALALYRQRVDPVAQQWTAEAIARRDAAALARVVDQFFASSAGDEALWSLGELALEAGDYCRARGYWQALIERPPEVVPQAAMAAALAAADRPPAELARLDQWYAEDASHDPPLWRLRHDRLPSDDAARWLVAFWKERGLVAPQLAYPGTQLNLADVRAALVLASIREEDGNRAREELAAFAQLHPDAPGTIEGRRGNYAELLSGQLAAMERWSARAAGSDWTTFGGNFARAGAARRLLDVGAPAWPPLPLEPVSADVINVRTYSSRRVGESSLKLELLSYHPLVVGELLLYCTQTQIFAFDRRTGQPAWPRDPRIPAGQIYPHEPPPAATSDRFSRGLGVPRFTMTVHEGKLYARMGSQVTSRATDAAVYREPPRALVCLDLAAEARLVFELAPQDAAAAADGRRWAFEGPPVVSGDRLYVGMRKSSDQPQAFVACFELGPQPPRLRWRTKICAAQTAGGGQHEEMTHNLLTLAEGTLYYNTNLGAVAALDAASGDVRWIATYPRAKRSGGEGFERRAAHFYRDLNPCLYYRSRLLVAPADCQSIFALDACSGELLWETHLADDAIHLLGVAGGNLLASGDRLWWIDADGGRIVGRWPDEQPWGHGRGVLAGEAVLWPTREAIYVFDARVQRNQSPRMLREPIQLVPRAATGGNLVLAGDLLLVAAEDRLYAFGESAGLLPAKNSAPLGQPADEPQPQRAPPDRQAANDVPPDSPPLQERTP